MAGRISFASAIELLIELGVLVVSAVLLKRVFI